jgi:beta-glucosidase
MNFGNVSVGTFAERTLTISSTGNSPLTVTGIVVPAGYSTNFATVTIEPGSTRQVTVRLTPTQPIAYAGILTVTGDQTSGNGTVSITGVGTTGSSVVSTRGNAGRIARIAIVGPHADDVEIGFATYTYPAGLKMMHARATGGDIAMAGIDLGGGAPAEARAAVAAELAPVFKTDRRTYLKSNYAATSLAEAVRQLLPKAEVTASAGTGVVPSEPTDIPAAVAAAKAADVVILAVGGRSAWSNERTEGEGSDTANKDLPPQQR